MESQARTVENPKRNAVTTLAEHQRLKPVLGRGIRLVIGMKKEEKIY